MVAANGLCLNIINILVYSSFSGNRSYGNCVVGNSLNVYVVAYSGLFSFVA